MRYNIWRPIILILVAFATKNLVASICMLFGMAPESAESAGFIGMIAAGLIMYNRLTKSRRK
ncbi:hypothetical protein [Paenibacillus dakarensis]|uniref:hypothetical protein n=1 Tax=Paenibacillus dakarensis TaxID=1527293 RepID=UPI0006D59746|nr:hypothetical protein [Paenibacillus dakarensis]